MTGPYDQLAADGDDGGPARPEPVLDAARLGGLVSALTTALGAVVVVFGLASLEDVSRWTVALTALVGAGVALVTYVAPVLQARKARALVTPVASPRSAAGVPLVEDRRTS